MLDKILGDAFGILLIFLLIMLFVVFVRDMLRR